MGNPHPHRAQKIPKLDDSAEQRKRALKSVANKQAKKPTWTQKAIRDQLFTGEDALEIAVEARELLMFAVKSRAEKMQSAINAARELLYYCAGKPAERVERVITSLEMVEEIVRVLYDVAKLPKTTVDACIDALFDKMESHD